MIGANEPAERIVQELVPGKEITLAHLIANPDASIYEKLGVTPVGGSTGTALGILTVTPSETAVILADIAIKASGVQLLLMSLESGSLIISGTVSQVEASILAIMSYADEKLGFTVCKTTHT